MYPFDMQQCYVNVTLKKKQVNLLRLDSESVSLYELYS